MFFNVLLTCIVLAEIILTCAAVVAQLVEWSLPKSEVHGFSPIRNIKEQFFANFRMDKAK